MKSIGSIWRKWDLHIHTPASYEWRGGKKFTDQTQDEIKETCKQIAERMETLNIDAFGVMDYWTFDRLFLSARIS